MRNFFNNQSGFSMVQGLIIAGVVAGSSLVATRMMTDQKMAQKGAETRDLVEELNNVVYSVLQERLNCKETIVRNNLHLTMATSTSQHNLTQLWTKDSLVAQVADGNPGVGVYMNNSVAVKSIVLGPPAGGGFRNVFVTYERLNAQDASKRTKQGYGAKDITKTIRVRIQKDPVPGTPFSSCYAVSGGKASMNGTASLDTGNDISKQMCEEMNTSASQKAFIWDEANSICKPNSKCPANQIYTGIDTLGDVKCRNIEDWMDFNQVLDSTAPNCPAGSQVSFQIDNANKKVRIICL